MKQLSQDQLDYIRKIGDNSLIRRTSDAKKLCDTNDYIAHQQISSIIEFFVLVTQKRGKGEKVEVYGKHFDIVSPDGKRKVVNGEDELDAAFKMYKEVNELNDIVY